MSARVRSFSISRWRELTLITTKDIFRFVVLAFVIAFSIVFVSLIVAGFSLATVARSGGITVVAGGVSEVLLLSLLIGLALAALAYLIVNRRKPK